MAQRNLFLAAKRADERDGELRQAVVHLHERLTQMELFRERVLLRRKTLARAWYRRVWWLLTGKV